MHCRYLFASPVRDSKGRRVIIALGGKFATNSGKKRSANVSEVKYL